jgi:hypothetical protein
MIFYLHVFRFLAIVYNSLTKSPFFDIVHRLFVMTQDVSVAGSVSKLSHFAVTSLGQELLSGVYLIKLTDPWYQLNEKGSIWGVH